MRTRQERNCRVRLERRAGGHRGRRARGRPPLPKRVVRSAPSPRSLPRLCSADQARESGALVQYPVYYRCSLRVFWDANRPAALGFLPRPHDWTLTASTRRREGSREEYLTGGIRMRRLERERPAAPSAAAAVGLFDPVAALLLLRRRPHRCPPPGLPAAVCD